MRQRSIKDRRHQAYRALFGKVQNEVTATAVHLFEGELRDVDQKSFYTIGSICAICRDMQAAASIVHAYTIFTVDYQEPWMDLVNSYLADLELKGSVTREGVFGFILGIFQAAVTFDACSSVMETKDSFDARFPTFMHYAILCPNFPRMTEDGTESEFRKLIDDPVKEYIKMSSKTARINLVKKALAESADVLSQVQVMSPCTKAVLASMKHGLINCLSEYEFCALVRDGYPK